MRGEEGCIPLEKGKRKQQPRLGKQKDQVLAVVGEETVTKEWKWCRKTKKEEKKTRASRYSDVSI